MLTGTGFYISDSYTKKGKPTNQGFPLYMRDSVLYPNLIFFENYTTFAYVVNL